MTRDSKRRRTDHDDEESSYFVLIGGEARESQGSPCHNEREFLHTSVSFVGQAYQSLRDAGIPRKRIVTICQLDDYRSMLKKGVEGRLTERRTGPIETRFYQRQLEETELHCKLLLEEGGADYDFDMVNPATVWSVLAGERSAAYPKVVPKCASGLFFAVYSHGDSHSTTSCSMSNAHDHRTAEWFAHFPYPSPRDDIYDFVATEGAGKEAPYYLYSTQLRLLFHRLFSETPDRPVVGLLNYCTSGGNLEFMRRPAVVRSLGVDQWPLYLMSSSGKSADSLVAGLWQSVFQVLSSSLEDRDSHHTIESLFEAAVCAYHKENLYDLLNECKERAFSEPVWRLDFRLDGGDCEPWHTDLRERLLGEDGKPNIGALRELQDAYTKGKAFRIVKKTNAQRLDGGLAKLPGDRRNVVVWARDPDSLHSWRKIPDSKPYYCPITGWQGDNADVPVDLADEVMMAFQNIARPEFVCGDKRGIRAAKVVDILG